MIRNSPPTAAQERAALESMRQAAQLLLESTDPLLKAQYAHLSGRIEALIAIHDAAPPAEDRP